MLFVYLVRCNFSCADRERAWNDWYNGPKLANMLAKPLFLSGQRFTAAGLDTRVKYLAVWELESPDAFETPQYRSDWGFAEWSDCIVDWNRDLCRLDDAAQGALACPPSGALHLVRIEEPDEEQARRLRFRIGERCPDLRWAPAVGLDHSASVVGLRVLERAGSADGELSATGGDLPRVTETVFRPVTDQTRAGS